MYRSFVTAGGKITSELLDNRECLKVGTRLRATRALHICADAIIEKGEQGTIDYANPLTGASEVLWDTRHRGLDGWDNHTLLEPFDTDDILGGLEVSQAPRMILPRVSTRVLAVAACIMVSLGFAVLHNFFMVAPAYEFTLIRDLDIAAGMFTRSLVVCLGLTYAALPA